MSDAPHGLSIVTTVVPPPADRTSVNGAGATSTTVAIGGDFDATQVDHFEQAVAALPADDSTVTVDITERTIVDSAALGALIRLKLLLDDRGTSLRLIADRPFQRQILEHTGLVEFLGLDAPSSGTVV